MKLLLTLLLLSQATCWAEVDLNRLLTAIAEKETGNRALRGRAGERTIYQILPATWRRFSRVPIDRATPAEARRVALAYLHEIRKNLYEETPYNYALHWNAGSSATRFSRQTRDYAQCVANLYHGPSHSRP